MAAVEYERVFAEQAKKRHSEAVSEANRNRPSGPCEESLPHMESEDRGPHATDEAGDLFNVSGRTVRDAQKAPYWGRIRILSDFHAFPIPKYG